MLKIIKILLLLIQNKISGKKFLILYPWLAKNINIIIQKVKKIINHLNTSEPKNEFLIILLLYIISQFSIKKIK